MRWRTSLAMLGLVIIATLPVHTAVLATNLLLANISAAHLGPNTVYFEVSITPIAVANMSVQEFYINVRANGTLSIEKVNITGPLHWELKDFWFDLLESGESWWPDDRYDGGVEASQRPSINFTGGSIASGDPNGPGDTFILKMNATDTGPWGDTYDEWNFTVGVKYTGESKWNYTSIEVRVEKGEHWGFIEWDIDWPTCYDGKKRHFFGEGANNYVWINITFSDDVNETSYTDLNINVTAGSFQLYKSWYVGVHDWNHTTTVVDSFNWTHAWRNSSTILSDVPMHVEISGVDFFGHSNSTEYDAVLDVTPPSMEIHPEFFKNGLGWIPVSPSDDQIPQPSGATLFRMKVTVYDYNETSFDWKKSLVKLDGTIAGYFNSPGSNGTMYFAKSGNAIPSTVNVTIFDLVGHRVTKQWTVSVTPDTEPPEMYDVKFKWFNGGLALKKFNASDNVAIFGYNIYLDGNLIGTMPTITNETLYTTEWTGNPVLEFTLDGKTGGIYAFMGCLILNLTQWGGELITIEVRAVDSSLLESTTGVSDSKTLGEGRIFPIPLYPGWNLISFPLIPKDKDTEDILADGLLLYGEDATPSGVGQGALIRIIYGYDDDWSGDWRYADPYDTVDRKIAGSLTTMEDGRGYWVNVREGKYDVLVIEGDILLPPSDGVPVPPVYSVDPKWNLAGYKSILRRRMFEYLQALPDASENNTMIFTWDPKEQNYVMLNPENYFPGPGYGFWLFWPESEDAYYTPPTP